MKYGLLFPALLLGALSGFAIPRQVNYQGHLSAPGGASLDTVVAMTFAVYDAPGGGAALWAETHAAVTVDGGAFNVILGSVSPLPDVFDNATWLGTTVGNDAEMAPRQPVASVVHAYRVGTVDGANGGSLSGKINIGSANSNPGDFAFVAGQNNHAYGNYSVIAGGGGVDPADSNSATGWGSVVGGGMRNRVAGSTATIAGGWSNTVTVPDGAISGGIMNTVSGQYGAVSGGLGNMASALHTVVGGGWNNSASFNLATVGGGGYNTSSAVQATVAGGSNNTASGQNASVAGGDQNSASGNYSAIGGGQSNIASNARAVVAGGSGNIASGLGAGVAGGEQNTALGTQSHVSGGVLNTAVGTRSVIAAGYNNIVYGQSASVSGGENNTANASYSTIAGGYGNATSGQSSCVSGGQQNSATANYSSVAGGLDNRATGLYATVGGGIDNRANTTASFAAGYRARANHSGSFVWSSTGVGTDSTASFAVFSFTARCSGGARFYTAQTGTATGVSLPAGGGAWGNLCDANEKHVHGDVNTAEILNRVAGLPLHEWSYKSQDESIRHIGPTAQDFHAAFGLGDNNTTISTLDPDGVALAAIQQLAKENAELKARLARVESLLQAQLAGEQKVMQAE